MKRWLGFFAGRLAGERAEQEKAELLRQREEPWLRDEEAWLRDGDARLAWYRKHVPLVRDEDAESSDERARLRQRTEWLRQRTEEINRRNWPGRRSQHEQDQQALLRLRTEEINRQNEQEARRRQEAPSIFVERAERFHRETYEVEMTDAEKVLLNTIAPRFDPACLLVDTYLDKGDGTTTQIDIIAICRQGIIVIESKGLGGTISGKADAAEWIHEQSQRRIYNPIRQNDLHVKAICQTLEPTKTREGSGTPQQSTTVAAQARRGNRASLFEVADTVEHKVFGVGTVTAVMGDKVTVAFKTGGSKNLRAGVAPLIVLARSSPGDRSPGGETLSSRPYDPTLLPGAVYSLVVFNDDATFPDLRFLPERCYVTKLRRVNEVIEEIMSVEPVLSDTEVMEIAYRIRQERVTPDREVREAHIRDIQRAIGRDRVLE